MEESEIQTSPEADAVAGDQQRATPEEELLVALLNDLDQSGFRFDSGLVQRFATSLLTKRFVILTGVTGSGKTRLAQAFAYWISGGPRLGSMVEMPIEIPDGWLRAGEDVPADQAIYRVDAVDTLAVQFSNECKGQRVYVTLPNGLIGEWIETIQQYGYSRDTPARTIREQVAKITVFSTQLNSFETHLKAAAFAILGRRDRKSLAGEASTAASARRPFASGSEPGNASIAVVAVGADWTSGESILGYPDALQPTAYIRTPALELILRANANPGVPHFLILDEMNLSHVERYFSDVLSSMESGEPIHLYSLSGTEVEFRDGVPPAIHLPDNLFIVGTVNIDETTYMFSPKVLDRANTIEFRVSADALEAFLEDPTTLDLERLHGGGSRFAPAFLRAARNPQSRSSGPTQARVNAEIELFFAAMALHGNEFGFRTALEMSRFIYQFQSLSRRSADLDRAIDAQIYQKILPRLSGSRARLEPVLRSLLVLCRHERQWENRPNGQPVLVNRNAILDAATNAGASPQLVAAEPSELTGTTPAKTALYPLSETKLLRMFRLLSQNGFTSFAEA